MFTKQSVINKIKEAENLVDYVEKHGKDVGAFAMIRWFIVADEATGLIKAAEEFLGVKELNILKRKVNKIKSGKDLWAKYKYNPRRAKLYFGKELHE